MTPSDAQATAGALVRAERKGPAAVRMILAGVPVGSLPGVVEALAAQANRTAALVPNVPRHPNDWTPGDARKAHAQYFKGWRDPWTVAGERYYQRTRKQRQRALLERRSA